MHRAVCSLVVVLTIAVPANADDDRVTQELQRFAGKWIQVSVEGDGKVMENGPNAPGMTISGDVWIENSPAGETTTRFTINPAKDPPQIDRVFVFGRQTVTIPGIYKLENDQLTIAMPIPFGGKLSHKRPTSFVTKPGDPFAIIVYKRIGVADEPQPPANVANEPQPPANADNDRVKLELQRFAGKWIQVSVEADGKVMDNSGPGMTISGDFWIETSRFGESATKFTIDPTKEPRQIDRVFILDLAKLEVSVRGIYKIDDDRLIISMAGPLSERMINNRPSSFVTKPGDPFFVTVYKRIGAADAMQPLAWETDWKKAFAAAKDQRRMVFVDYFPSSCKVCRDMDDTFFVLPSVREKLSDFVLLRVDDSLARAKGIKDAPTYVVYDPGERERFRIGLHPPLLFREELDRFHSAAPNFLSASDLFDQKKDIEAHFLAGNSYSHLRMNQAARAEYSQARNIAERLGQRAPMQLADALSAFTLAREGKSSDALKALQKLAAAPADRQTEALIWLTMGNVHRLAKDRKAAVDAFRRAQSLATPDSTEYRQATEAIATLQQ